jgi:hypothetical protein
MNRDLRGFFNLTAAGAHAQFRERSALTAESFGIDRLELPGAETVAAGTDLGRPGPAPVDHCSVTARIGHHTGIDGNRYPCAALRLLFQSALVHLCEPVW